MSLDKALTIEEVAEIAAVSPAVVRSWILQTPPLPRLRAFSPRVPRSRKGHCEFRILPDWLTVFLDAQADAVAEAHAQADWQPQAKPPRPINRATGRTTVPPLKELLADRKGKG